MFFATLAWISGWHAKSTKRCAFSAFFAPFMTAQSLRLQHGLVPLDGQRCSLVGHGLQPSVPNAAEDDLRVGQHLRRQRAGVPELPDARTHPVERLERAVDVDRIELVLRHTVGQKRELEV